MSKYNNEVNTKQNKIYYVNIIITITYNTINYNVYNLFKSFF